MLGTGYQQEVRSTGCTWTWPSTTRWSTCRCRSRPWSTWPSATPWPGAASPTSPSRPTSRSPTPGANPWQRPAPAVVKPTAAVISCRPPGMPGRRGPSARRRRPQRGRQGGHAGRRGRTGTPATRCWRWPRPGRARSSRRCPGKAVVPDDHPLTTGGIGLLGTAPSEEAMEKCDTLLMVGTNFPYTKYLPEPARPRSSRSKPTPSGPATESPPRSRSSATPSETLRGLAPCSSGRSDTLASSRRSQKEMGKWRKNMTRAGDIETDPIQPQHLMAVIDRLAADDAILTCDSGTIATWAARHFTIRGERRVLPVREPGHHGAGPAVRDRHPAGLIPGASASPSSATVVSPC